MASSNAVPAAMSSFAASAHVQVVRVFRSNDDPLPPPLYPDMTKAVTRKRDSSPPALTDAVAAFFVPRSSALCRGLASSATQA